MYKIFHTLNVKFTKRLSDDLIGGQRNSLFVNSSETSLVKKILNNSSGRSSIGDPWFNSSKHVHGSLVVSDEDSVSDLSESEQSHDLLLLRRYLSDTLDSDHKEEFSLSLYKELRVCFCFSSLVDESLLFSLVLVPVLFTLLKSILLTLLLALDCFFLSLFCLLS